MKRFIFLLLAVVMLLSLTACGDNKTNGSMTEPTASPSMSPMVSPNVSDGIVNDTDGIIGNVDEPNSTANMGGSTARRSQRSWANLQKNTIRRTSISGAPSECCMTSILSCIQSSTASRR